MNKQQLEPAYSETCNLGELKLKITEELLESNKEEKDDKITLFTDPNDY